MALDDIPHEAVKDGIAELDEHRFKRYLRYFATDLVRLCARDEKDVRRMGGKYRVKLRFRSAEHDARRQDTRRYRRIY